jgi:hypothetical protein
MNRTPSAQAEQSTLHQEWGEHFETGPAASLEADLQRMTSTAPNQGEELCHHWFCQGAAI